MAIAATPNNFYVTQGNQQVYLQWDIEAGATTYTVQRSLDGITYSTIASPATNYYLDTTVTIGINYYYQVASTNGSGTSNYTIPQSIVPTPVGEMTLAQVRLAAQQRADRVNSQFVTLPEWNSYINQALAELYDLLVTSYEDYFLAPYAVFSIVGNQQFYDLPNGSNTFQDANGSNFIPEPFYKMRGVDLALSTASNAWVTLRNFMYEDRNTYIYPNSNSTIYGVFNLQYRVMGTKIEFIPTPSSGQKIRLGYIPRLRQLLRENDITTIGFSGWLEYAIVRAAIYALAKEESDTSGLERQLLFVKQRIEESAANRDVGQPQTIVDVRKNGYWGSGPGGFGGGPIGGW